MEQGLIDWVGLGVAGRDYGATGVASHGGHAFVLIQSNRRPRLIALDLRDWSRRKVLRLRHVRDPHSLAFHDGALYVASTGDNAVYRLTLDGARVAREELYWRYPGASGERDEVHLNAIAFVDGEMVVSVFGPRASDGSWGDQGLILNARSGQAIFGPVDQPHTLLYRDGRLVFCESRTGRVHIGAPSERGGFAFSACQLVGYTRGLCFAGEDLLVGVSGHRAASRSTKKPMDMPEGAHRRSGLYRLSLSMREASPVMDLTEQGNEIYDLAEIDAARPAKRAQPKAGWLRERLVGPWPKLAH